MTEDFLPFLQFCQDLPAALPQGFKHSHSLIGHGLKTGLILLHQGLFQFLHRKHTGQVALVELEHVRNLPEVVIVLVQVLVQVLQCFNVGVHSFFLGIRHKHHAVHAPQNQLAAGVVEDLPRHRVKMEAGFEPANTAEVEGKEIEEKSAVGFCSQGDHFPAGFPQGLIKNPLEVGGLTAQTSAVVNDLAVDFAGSEVNETHAVRSPSPRLEALPLYRIQKVWPKCVARPASSCLQANSTFQRTGITQRQSADNTAMSSRANCRKPQIRGRAPCASASLRAFGVNSSPAAWESAFQPASSHLRLSPAAAKPSCRTAETSSEKNPRGFQFCPNLPFLFAIDKSGGAEVFFR